MTKEKKKNSPVFDLPVLPVPSVSDVTPEIAKKLTRTYLVTRFQQIAQQQATKQILFTDLPLMEKASWERHLVPLTPEQQILWCLGFDKWRESGEKIYEKFRRHKVPLMPCYASIFQHSMLNLRNTITMLTKAGISLPSVIYLVNRPFLFLTR